MGAVRRHVKKLNRSGREVPDWQARLCIYGWRLWYEQRAVEAFENAALECSM